MNKYIDKSLTHGWTIRESGQITAAIINKDHTLEHNAILKQALEDHLILPSDMVCIEGKWWYVKEWMKENGLWLVNK